MQNISKYVAINDFLLLEYEFNRDSSMIDISGMGATVATTSLGTKQYFNNNKTIALGVTNNVLELNSLPTDAQRSTWFNNYDDTTRYYNYFSTFDASIATENNSDEYPHDTVKLHIISGYNFDDIVGFLLQIRAQDSSGNLVDLCNFSYLKQSDILGSSDVVKFCTSPLYLGNKFFDKYVIFKIPSVYALGNDTAIGYDSSLGQALDIAQLSDVHISYSTLPTIQGDTVTDDNTFTLAEQVDFQLPVTSSADLFNIYIAESTSGDYIEYYATWNDQIIGQYMGDIENGRIALYTSNNPNDNYAEFTEVYGTDSLKWVLIHELYVYENLTGGAAGSSLLTQKFSFTQDDNFSLPNLFRPVLKNADIDVSYTIQYTCRLSNRMDGTQIIRTGTFASTDPAKYGLEFTRINVDNIIPYRVFNKIEEEQTNVVEGALTPKTKYVKVFYDTTGILYNEQNELYPQGIGPLLLKKGDSVYKFKFEKYNGAADQRENVDLSGAYNYALMFILDDETKIESVPTYSTNMNTVIGELEFKLTEDQINQLLKQNNKSYSIIVKNPNGTYYSFYEGIYDSYADYNAVVEEAEIVPEESETNVDTSRGLISRLRGVGTSLRTQIASLNKKIVDLQASIKALTEENAALRAGRRKTPSPPAESLNKPARRVRRKTPSSLTDQPSRKVVEQNERISNLEKENRRLTRENNERDQTIRDRDQTIRNRNRLNNLMD